MKIKKGDLISELSSLDEDMQKLKLKLNGLHPDDAMSDIAYEKGYFFLRMLEEKKGRAKMDSFLKNYFDMILKYYRFRENFSFEILSIICIQTHITFDA